MKVDRLALPYRVDLARDKTHLHIRSANDVPVADVHTQFGTPAAVREQAEFIVQACNSYEHREALLRTALDALVRCRDSIHTREGFADEFSHSLDEYMLSLAAALRGGE